MFTTLGINNHLIDGGIVIKNHGISRDLSWIKSKKDAKSMDIFIRKVSKLDEPFGAEKNLLTREDLRLFKDLFLLSSVDDKSKKKFLNNFNLKECSFYNKSGEKSRKALDITLEKGFHFLMFPVVGMFTTFFAEKKLDLKDIKVDQNRIHSCYLDSALLALQTSTKGKEILYNLISESKEKQGIYLVRFDGIKKDGKSLEVEVSNQELVSIKNAKLSRNQTTKIIEIATRKLLKKKRFDKAYLQPEPLNFYFSSWMLKYLTGTKPKSSGDIIPFSFNSIFSKAQKNKADKILEKASLVGEDNFSMTACTSYLFPSTEKKENIAQFHYYAVKKVDHDNEKIYLINPRKPEVVQEITYEKFFKLFRSVNAYFWNDKDKNEA